jgi:2-isopropylmalate synthase
VLCDTNGGALPHEIEAAIAEIVRAGITTPLGIHCHNDADVAVANSLVAVEAGVQQVQGCANGYGERCGNANIFSVIANLKLKLGVNVIPDENLARLTDVSHYVAEICNMVPNPHQAYVGASAFSHKGGMHVAAVVKHRSAYEHVPPAAVGNDRNILISELAGQRNILAKMDELGINMPLTSDEVRAILEKVKVLESRGYQYDGSEASFELLVRRDQPGYTPPFEIEDFLVVERRRHTRNGDDHNEMLAEAMVKVKVNGRIVQTASEGNGPVNALDNAVRKALLEFYPRLSRIKLLDYKVRILDADSGTSAAVRALIESSDGEHVWRTVGSSTDILEASWLALNDALEWWLLRYGLDEMLEPVASGVPS